MPETILILGKSVSLYYLFWLLALAVTLAVAATMAKHFGYSPYRGLTLSAVALSLGVVAIWALSLVFGGFNMVRGVLFYPLIDLLVALAFKESYRKLTDFLAPVAQICSGLSHLGCIFSGCCHGYPASWGIYSNHAETVCFPVQPIEAVVNVAIGIWLIVMIKRKRQQGKLMLWMMTLFGITRFFLEFLRDNRKVWGNVSELALFALATFLVGVAGLILVTYFDKRRCNNEKN